jgi:disulfide oxidoreductase YuzD
MKKLLVKIKVIDIPYSPAVEAIPAIEAVEGVEARPEKWVKDELEVFEEPMIEVALGEFEVDSSFTHYPAVEAVEAIEGVEGVDAIPEILEESHEEVIAQTQGSDEELAEWLEGDKFKYPEGHWLEYVDITEQVEQDKVNAEALKYLASTDWLIVREVETQVLCPQDIKQLRAEARAKVIR